MCRGRRLNTDVFQQRNGNKTNNVYVCHVAYDMKGCTFERKHCFWLAGLWLFSRGAIQSYTRYFELDGYFMVVFIIYTPIAYAIGSWAKGRALVRIDAVFLSKMFAFALSFFLEKGRTISGTPGNLVPCMHNASINFQYIVFFPAYTVLGIKW